MSQKVLLNAKEVNIILHRLACQLIENHNDFSETVLIGLQPRGKFLADRLAKDAMKYYNIPNIQLGHLDITSGLFPQREKDTGSQYDRNRCSCREQKTSL